MKTERYIIVLLAVTAAWAAAASAQVRVSAQVDTGKDIYVGENFGYYIVIKGTNQAGQVDLAPLQPYNPQSTGNRNQSSINVINGTTTQSVTTIMTYSLTANRVGRIQIPSLTVEVQGRTYHTNPVSVNVLKPGTTDRLDLDVTLSEHQCYVGQPVIMTVKFYISATIGDFQFNIPALSSDAFYIEDPDVSNGQAKAYRLGSGITALISQYRVTHNGMDSVLLSFSKVLIPKRSGPIDLPAASVSAAVAVGRVRSNDPFDSFFGAQTRYKQFMVTSEPFKLTVRPVPDEGKPAQFYGLVGQYTISASATPTSVNVGDPITLTIKIGGNKYLKPVRWPALEELPELAANFKIPSQKASPTIEDGFKVFTQTIRANNDKVTEIPSIPLAYFDAAKGAYVTAKTQPIELRVAPTKVLTSADLEGAGFTPVNREVEAIKKGLSANYEGLDVLHNMSFSPLAAVTSPGYAALWALPLMLLVSSTVIRICTRTSPERVAAKRRRRACGKAVGQLKKLRVEGVPPANGGNVSRASRPRSEGGTPSALRGQDGRDTIQPNEQLASIMKHYIGERFDKTAGSLTPDDCYEAIAAATKNAQAAEQYRQTVAGLDAGRYAPMEINVDADRIKEVIALIRTIEKDAGRAARSTSGRSARARRRVPALLLAAAFALSWLTAPAQAALSRQDAYALLNQANRLFRKANSISNDPNQAKRLYERAILNYEKIVRDGHIRNSKLFYDLGNAYFLKQDLGRAILNYRRAEKLDKSDANVQKNLAFARSRRFDKVDVKTEKRVLETLFFWHYDFSTKTKFLLMCIGFAMLCVSLTVMIWRGRTAPPVVTAAIGVLLTVCFLTSVILDARNQSEEVGGVITASQVIARQGDGPNYPESFKDALHAGTEFDLLERRPGWFHIKLSDGSDGWIPDKAAELI
jgi:tetratricopeptide (TPR) repeat protein